MTATDFIVIGGGIAGASVAWRLAAHGRVRIEREVWRADSIDGHRIAKDAVVKVMAVSGTRVLVREQGPHARIEGV